MISQNPVLKAVASAAQRTGVDFTYLMEKASQESGLNPAAKAKGSSATGLFQFIENTWLSMVSKAGHKYGLGDLAEKISFRDDGRAIVADRKTRKEILELRKDPELSALMAAEFTALNKQTLEEKTSGVIGSTELYLAHFLGAGSAAKFINALHSKPETKAAALFPDAAAANRSVFYTKEGRARSLNEIYANFDRKFTDAGETLVARLSPRISAPHSQGSRPDTPLAFYRPDAPFNGDHEAFGYAPKLPLWTDDGVPSPASSESLAPHQITLDTISNLIMAQMSYELNEETDAAPSSAPDNDDDARYDINALAI